MRTISVATTLKTKTSFSPTTSPASAVLASGAQRSPWHSPVPCLFGGLATMLGLIAFALLILACSYWKLSSGQENREARDLDNGTDEKEGDSASIGSVKVYEEKVLVIMAGDDRPTFLATPVTAKIISLDDGIVKDVSNENNSKNENSIKIQRRKRATMSKLRMNKKALESRTPLRTQNTTNCETTSKLDNFAFYS